MKLRKILPADFMSDGIRLHEWGQAIADQSAGEFVIQELMSLIGKTHEGHFYCDDGGGEWGIIISTVVKFRHGRTLVIVGAAGKVDVTWGELTELFNELALNHRCTSFEIKGRRGFLRAMSPHGWSEKYTTITCPVTPP